MHGIRIALGLLALLAFSLGAFHVQHSEGARVDWVSMGLAIFTLMYMLQEHS